MASKQSAELSTRELEELLDAVEMTMDRLKTLYEQYFLGIQKQAPQFIHADVERKLRDMQQMQMRNTGLRYRLATLQQKFGSYNSYWRRTLRQIENGTYLRNLAKVGRDAARSGAEIPEEILAKMPKRMRDQVVRDREAAIAIAKRRNLVDDVQTPDEQTGETAAPEFPPDADDVAAMISEPSILRREFKTHAGAHVLAEDDADLDFDSFFAAFDDDAPKAKPTPAPPPRAEPPRPDPASTQAITRPISKMPPAGVPGMSLRTPAPTVQPTTAIPRVPAAEDVAPEVGPFTPIPGQTTQMPRVAPPGAATTQLPRVPATSAVPRVPGQPPATGAVPQVPAPGQAPATGVVPRVPAPGQPAATTLIPRVPTPGQPDATAQVPRVAGPPRVPPPAGSTQGIPRAAPSQASRPNPIAPGSAAQTGPTPVESMTGPFPRPDRPVTQTVPRVTPPPPRPPMKPPPGMTEADVNALHAKYVQAKEAIGEKVDASSRERLMRTITQTAPKIMEQYKSAGVDFSVVVKDNQVVIKAKPKG